MTALKSGSGGPDSCGDNPIGEGTMRRTLLAVALLALALSACELRAEIAVNENGSGTLGVTFAVEPETLALFNLGGAGDPFAEMKADFADDPVTWTVQDFTEGKLKGIRATFPFSSIDDLREKSRLLDSGGNSDAGFEDFTLERRGEGWVFEGRSTDTQSALSGGGQVPIPPEQLEKLVNIQLRSTLPGKASTHNANQVTASGGRTTFIWKPKFSAKSIDLRAQTMPGDGSSLPVLPVALGLGGLGAVGAVLALRRKAAPAAMAPEVTLRTEEVSAVVGGEPTPLAAPMAPTSDDETPQT